MSRRIEMLGAVALGCAAGWILCTATSCGSARADAGSLMTVPCNVQGPDASDPKNGTAMWAVQSFPGRNRFDLALNVFKVADPPPAVAPVVVQGIAFGGIISSGVEVADGSVAVQCNGGPGCTPSTCPPPASIQLYVR